MIYQISKINHQSPKIKWILEKIKNFLKLILILIVIKKILNKKMKLYKIYFSMIKSH
jgi:hypothetical protein